MTDRLRVLIVDDNPDDRALAARELARGFPDIRTIEVADAAAFETALERGGFDLVITEFRLGWSDGLAVFRELKHRHPEIPVIMLTGVGSEEIAVEAMRAGLDDYFMKAPEHVVNLPLAAAAALEHARERRARRQAEEALHESEAHLRALFASMSDVILVLDRDGRYLEIAPTSPELLYAPAAETLGKTEHELFAPAQADAFLEAIRKALDTRSTVEIEYMLQIRHMDMWFAASISPMLEDSVVWVARDITQRKRAEEALRESEELFRTSFENATTGVCLVRTDGRFLRVNRTMCQILGYTEEELEQLTFNDVTHSEDKEMGDSLVESALSGYVNSTSLEKRYIHKDGHTIWAHVSTALLRDATGEPRYFITHIRDITERKRAEDALVRSEGRIRELLGHLFRAQEEERARIAGDIHDDSIQVMTAVGLRLGTLQRRLTDPETLDTLQPLVETVTSAISRLRHQMFELRPRVLDEDGLAPALRMYLDHMSDQVQIEYTLVNRLEEEPSPAARTVLYRIAQEALVNIRKHANAARVEVVLEPREAGYAVKITDDGSGFEVGAVERTPGHLGLAAMRERAEMVGGWWRIESTPGEGTTVEFWVPAEVD